MSADLEPAAVQAALHTRWLGRNYRFLPVCGSTNDEAAALARREDSPREGLLVVAESQTGGRGRLGRSWFSPSGQNLYLSLVLRPALPPASVPPLTLLVGAVTAEVLALLGHGLRPRLKWPNDLLLETAAGLRKAAGVLTEMATERERVKHLVVGMGLNVNVASFPDELAEVATSLRLATGEGRSGLAPSFDRGMLLAALLDALEPAYEQFVAEGPGAAIVRWRRHARLGHRCRVVGEDGGAVEGVAEDVDAEGGLLVRDDAGRIHRIVSGEMT